MHINLSDSFFTRLVSTDFKIQKVVLPGEEMRTKEKKWKNENKEKKKKKEKEKKKSIGKYLKERKNSYAALTSIPK